MIKRRSFLLTAALSCAAGIPVSASAQAVPAAASIWTAPVDGFAHEDFGAPARVLSIRRDAVLDATRVTFSSGARLIVKHTRFTPGQVVVVASFGSGRAGVPAHLIHALWAPTLFPLGGTRHMSFAALDAWQKSSGHSVNVTLVPGASAFRLQGEVPSSELGLELALLTAYAHEPGFREEMGAKIASIGPQLTAQIDSDPTATFTRQVQHKLVGARYQELPEAADLAVTTGAELPAILEHAFEEAADITIVGDIEVDATVRAVAATLAAGDPRPIERGGLAHVGSGSDRSQPIARASASAPDGGRLGLYWRLPDGQASGQIHRTARVAAALIEARLVALQAGVPDSAAPPVARVASPADLVGGSYLGAVLPVSGGGVAKLRGNVNSILEGLSTGQFTDAELAQANKIGAVENGAEVVSNDWWAQHLGRLLRDQRSGPVLHDELAPGNVDRAAVVAFLRRYVGGGVPTEIVGSKATPAAVEGDVR